MVLRRVAVSIFILNALFFFFQALTKNVYPPLLLPIRETFAVGHSEAGLLVTLVFLGYALARFPSGVMADKWGCTRTILWGSLGMAVSFAAVALSPGYYSAAFFTFVLGVCSGIYVTAGYTLAVIIGGRARATTATAAFESFGVLAGIISPLMATVFVVYLNWPLLFAVLGMALGLLTLLYFVKRESSIKLERDIADASGDSNNDVIPEKSHSGGIWGEIRASMAIFSDPAVRRFIIWSTLVGGLGAISWTGVNSFIPTFLVEERGLSYDRANLMYTLVAIAGLATKIVIGRLGDRLGDTRVLAVNLFSTIILFSLLTLVQQHWQLLIILVFIGAACLNTNTLINSHVLRNMPPGYQGAGFGLFCSAYTIIYSAGPYITGYFSELWGLPWAIKLSPIGAAIALLLILLARYSVITVEIGVNGFE